MQDNHPVLGTLRAAVARAGHRAGTAADVAPIPQPGLVRLRKAQDRSFDCEGIPMFLALTRTAPAVDAPPPDDARAEGAHLAAELTDLRRELFPTRRDDDVGCLISTAQALTVGTFDSQRSAGVAARGTSPAPPRSLPKAEAGVTSVMTEYAGALRQGRYVRVLNFHNTAAGSRHLLRLELSQLARRFAVVGPKELDRFYATGQWADDRPAFLPVFYEGYRNNYEVAAQVCDELGIQAWFFVCTGFIDCPPGEQEQFARSHNISLLAAEHGRDRLAMTWDEVAELSRRHVVTPHTASHDGVADIVTDADLEREIIEPKRRMDSVTGQNAPAMAYLWGSPYGGSERHDAAVRAAGYRYFLSNTGIERID